MTSKSGRLAGDLQARRLIFSKPRNRPAICSGIRRWRHGTSVPTVCSCPDYCIRAKPDRHLRHRQLAIPAAVRAGNSSTAVSAIRRCDNENLKVIRYVRQCGIARWKSVDSVPVNGSFSNPGPQSRWSSTDQYQSMEYCNSVQIVRRRLQLALGVSIYDGILFSIMIPVFGSSSAFRSANNDNPLPRQIGIGQAARTVCLALDLNANTVVLPRPGATDLSISKNLYAD